MIEDLQASNVVELVMKRLPIYCLLEEFGGSIVPQMFLDEVKVMGFLAGHIKRDHITGIDLPRYNVEIQPVSRYPTCTWLSVRTSCMKFSVPTNCVCCLTILQQTCRSRE